jgi:hydrogenase-4 component E
MNLTIIDPLFVLVVLMNFFMLGTGRLKGLIKASAAQGALLGVAFAIAHLEPNQTGAGLVSLRTLALATAIFAIKGFVMPRMLMYAMRSANVQWRIDPYVGFNASLILGAAGTGLVMAMVKALPLRPEDASHLLVSTSLATMLTGFLLLSMRREALSQVVGYLVLENGIFIFGLLLVRAIPAIVEVGVLLDVFVGVFVMGIVIHHVHRQFPASTSDHLSALKE